MVANYTELLAQRYAGQLDERADKYIHYASDGARRMQRLVADLLAYSRVGSQGKPLVPVAAGEVLARFPGRWEVYHLMANTPAVQFWPGVIRGRAAGEIVREVRSLHGDECCLYRFDVALPPGA